MSEPFLAEIRIVGFNFAPRGWAFCDGQLLPINQNQSLYSLLGTTYGGDGRTSFALPDLRGRTPIHVGAAGSVSHPLGQRSGEETHTLSQAELPAHDHTLHGADSPANAPVPGGRAWAQTAATDPAYGNLNNNPAAMNDAVIAASGGSQAHNNMQPYLALNFCIALQGLFPSRN